MNTLERLQQYLASGEVTRLSSGVSFKEPLEPVVCADGFRMSVQASSFHYCSPRTNEGPWTSVEIWCCGCVPEFEATQLYPTGGEEPYERVPVEVVAQVIDSHGGFAPWRVSIKIVEH